jgi:hypothetical protein
MHVRGKSILFLLKNLVKILDKLINPQKMSSDFFWEKHPSDILGYNKYKKYLDAMNKSLETFKY